MKSDPGSYALLMYASEPVELAAGKLGVLFCPSGYYLYCGSAFGSGGLPARVGHHKRMSTRPHWHVDYLRQKIPLIEVWYCFEGRNLEHQWSELMLQRRGCSILFAGFGASDCRCESHLIYSRAKPSVDYLRQKSELLRRGERVYCEKVEY